MEMTLALQTQWKESIFETMILVVHDEVVGDDDLDIGDGDDMCCCCC